MSQPVVLKNLQFYSFDLILFTCHESIRTENFNGISLVVVLFIPIHNLKLLKLNVKSIKKKVCGICAERTNNPQEKSCMVECKLSCNSLHSFEGEIEMCQIINGN